MLLSCASHSTYPRVADGPSGQRLRQAYGKRERNEIDQTAFEATQDDVAREVLAEQAAALDVVTDGLVRWYDPISHVAGGLAGIEVAGLVRWFDTNFYVRQAIVRETPKFKAPYLVKEVQKAVATGKRVKAVVTGPYTLARFSIDQNQLGIAALTQAYAAALRPELEAIAALGTAAQPLQIQIDEPCLLDRRGASDWDVAASALRTLIPASGSAAASSWVATYFGDAEPVYDKLQALAGDGLVLDLTYAPKLLSRIAAQGSSKRLQLGAIDGRNTALEAIDSLRESLSPAIGKIAGDVFLTTSCGLEYLPRDRARRKTQHLQTLARSLAPARAQA